MNLPKAAYHDSGNYATIAGTRVPKSRDRSTSNSQAKTIPQKPNVKESGVLPAISKKRPDQPQSSAQQETEEQELPKVDEKRRASRKDRNEKTPVSDYKDD